MASSSTAAMVNFTTRLSSFLEVKKPKSKAKPAFPLTASTHPKLTPNDLASAGFFHQPSTEEDSWDTCRCFLCGLKLGGWDEEDDPYEEHVKRGSCAWAEFVCAPIVHRRRGTRPEYDIEEKLPSSVESAAFRETTYMKAWPHKQKSGWLPTVKNLARAGFVFQPSDESKDAAGCPLCEYSADGWEATDDPWALHQRKSPDCQFFTAQLQTAGPSKAALAKSTKSTKGSSRSKRATTAATDTQSIADEPEATVSQSASQLSKSTRKPRATTRIRGKRKEDEDESAVEVAETADEPAEVPADAKVEVEEPVDVAPVKEKKPRGRPKGKGKAKGEDKVAEATSEAPVEEPPKRSRKQPKTDPAEDAAPAKAKKERKKPGAKSKTKTSSKENSEVEPSEVESHASEPEAQADSAPVTTEPKSSSTSSKPSSSRQKPLPPVPIEITPPEESTPQPLSQLEGFANVPPSSPFGAFLPDEGSTPRPKATLRSSQPARPSPSAKLSREGLDKSVEAGAKEARRVMRDVAVNALVPEAKVALTDAEKGMTLEAFIRSEMRKAYEALEREGTAQIEAWERTAGQARRRIEEM